MKIDKKQLSGFEREIEKLGGLLTDITNEGLKGAIVSCSNLLEKKRINWDEMKSLFKEDFRNFEELLFRLHFKPRHCRLIELVRKSGKKIFFHNCGCRNELFDEILDLDIDGIWPQIALLDLESFSADCKRRGILTFIHPDRQHLIPRGRPEEIERTIAGYADHFHKLGGGGMFYVEIENDAPFENVEALVKAIDKYR